MSLVQKGDFIKAQDVTHEQEELHWAWEEWLIIYFWLVVVRDSLSLKGIWKQGFRNFEGLGAVKVTFSL